jgi:alginate O-acetyltransferase complex protein AlgI
VLFNSLAFLLVFLPPVLVGFYQIPTPDGRRIFIIVSSIVFYSLWDWRLTPVLLGSISGNYCFAYAYMRWHSRWIVVAGVMANLLLLGVFKYSDFVASLLAPLIQGQPHVPWNPVLPLGISFFTFQAIAYLVDLRRGNAKLYLCQEFASYLTFFPHLIAGPIVRHDELVGQFELDPYRPGINERIGRGLLLVLLGLVKKVFIADGAAVIANAGFAHPETVSLADAWLSAGAFAVQIYFDFSGYSDIAIGLALMFGLKFPINFNAPYRATSLIEFWRRWHITLSRFLREYLYIPLGGLWHGAGWTFIAWGGLHGAALAGAHMARRRGLFVPSALGWLLTMLVVLVGWMLFRAPNFAAATAMLSGMLGLHGGQADVLSLVQWNFGLIAVGMAVSILGPTSQTLALEWAKPRAWLAVTAGLAACAILLKVSDADYTPFIYFQF